MKAAAVPDALELTSKQLDELRGLLDEKRRELREGQRSTSVAALERQADEMDAASDATAEAETLGLSQHNNRLWKEIEHALAKFKDGTYGVSEESGEPIGFGRLRIIPWARLTVQEEEARERRAR